MGIISINGQQVYVVDSKPVAAAKASNGVGYAQLVSQQRWQLYEQAEKDVLRQMEFEKMSYQAQLDVYAKQKAQLQKSLLKTQEVKDKIKNGDYTFSQGLALVRMVRQREDAEIRDKMVSRTTTQTVDKYGEPITITSTRDKYLGDKNLRRSDVASSLERAKDQLGIETPKDKRDAAVAALEAEWKKGFANRKDKSLDEAAWAKSEEGKEIEDKLAAEKAKPLSDYAGTKDELKEFDEEISSLEKQLAALSVPEVGFDTNVGARTREAYAGMVGVGGLGLAPRKSKTSAVYDESRAREAMARQAAGFEDAIGSTAAANETDLRASLSKGAEIRKNARMVELQAASDLAGPEDVELKKLIDQEIQKLSTTAPTLTPEEEANIARTARQAAEQSFRATALETGPGQRTLQSFMDREPAETGRRPDDDPRKEKGPRKDIDLSFLAGLGALGRARSSDVYFGSGEGGEAGLSGTAPEGAITTPGRPYGDSDVTGPYAYSASTAPNYSGIVSDAGFGATTMPESGAPRREPLQTYNPSGGTAMQRLGALGGRREGDSAPSPVQVGGEAGISGPARISPAVDPQELWFKYAPINYEGDTGEQVQLTDEQKQQIADKFEKDRMTQSLRTKKQIEAWYKNEVDMLPKEASSGKEKKKTRLESYSANLMKVMQEGQKLADQPTKLQRLAKLDLPEKERAKVVPEHILLVDKLYNINSSKGNGFQTTFAEIERVYKNDDKKKKAAQEYLAAKEILTA
jgi:hypothetical protein